MSARSPSSWRETGNVPRLQASFEQGHDVLELHVRVDLEDEGLAELGEECELHRGVRSGVRCGEERRDAMDVVGGWLIGWCPNERL